MKITKKQLRRLVQEEMSRVLNEQEADEGRPAGEDPLASLISNTERIMERMASLYSNQDHRNIAKVYLHELKEHLRMMAKMHEYIQKY